MRLGHPVGLGTWYVICVDKYVEWAGADGSTCLRSALMLYVLGVAEEVISCGDAHPGHRSVTTVWFHSITSRLGGEAGVHGDTTREYCKLSSAVVSLAPTPNSMYDPKLEKPAGSEAFLDKVSCPDCSNHSRSPSS